MLRIEEIVGAMDDEFRDALDAFDDDRLTALKADQAALRRMRPVGVSNAEAVAMIDTIQQQRAHKLEQDMDAARKQLERAEKRKTAPRKRKPLAAAAPVVEVAVAEPVPQPQPQPQPEPEPQAEPVVAPAPIAASAMAPVAPPVAEASPAKAWRGRLLLVIVPVLLTVLALLAV